MKTYLSGQITGLPEDQAFQNFADAQTYFESLNYEVINPMLLPHNHDKRWKSYLREDIKALCDCEAIFMLSNFRNSKGARLEHHIAQELGLTIFYQP